MNKTLTSGTLHGQKWSIPHHQLIIWAKINTIDNYNLECSIQSDTHIDKIEGFIASINVTFHFNVTSQYMLLLPSTAALDSKYSLYQ